MNPTNSVGLTIQYGTDPEQKAVCAGHDRTLPAKGIVFLIHGGYWRCKYDLSLMDPLFASFREQGWAVVNIEYRRGPQNPWPIPLNDVELAVFSVLQSDWASKIGGPRAIVGHSVGGQLALLANTTNHVVVALSPVTDIRRTKDEKLGNDAAAEFFAAADSATIGSASPIEQLPIPVPALVVHGEDDRHVPFSHSLDFVAKAKRAGSEIELVHFEELDHFQIIDPHAKHWPTTTEWILNH